MGNDGALILGADLKKDPRRLHDAYDDSAGVTAAFTLNLLRRMNRELQATFDLDAFVHEAFYNPLEGRIEIYFRSLRPQSVTVAGRTFSFAEGERVHTEYSYKFDIAGIETWPAPPACVSPRPLDRSGPSLRRDLFGGSPLKEVCPPSSFLESGHKAEWGGWHRFSGGQGRRQVTRPQAINGGRARKVAQTSPQNCG